MIIKKGRKEDLDRIMEIYRYAQDFMIVTGNPTQWSRRYPIEEDILEDIELERCMTVWDEEGLHGVFALCGSPDPAYMVIEDGAWLNDEPYVVIHRIAGDGTGGVFRSAIEYCRSICDNIRIDTHENNKIMQHLIEKAGFTKCGTIYAGDGTPRIAYHWFRGME